MPFGQLPVLEEDGKRINQSTAICRYLAKKCSLNGTNDWEDLEIDATVDTISDLRISRLKFYTKYLITTFSNSLSYILCISSEINAAHYEKNADSKANKIAIAKEMTKLVISRLDDQVKRNSDYLVGGKLTWADIAFVAQLDLLNCRIGRDIIEGAKNLEMLRSKILELPNIKAWIDKRPQTDY